MPVQLVGPLHEFVTFFQLNLWCRRPIFQVRTASIFHVLPRLVSLMFDVFCHEKQKTKKQTASTFSMKNLCARLKGSQRVLSKDQVLVQEKFWTCGSGLGLDCNVKSLLQIQSDLFSQIVGFFFHFNLLELFHFTFYAKVTIRECVQHDAFLVFPHKLQTTSCLCMWLHVSRHLTHRSRRKTPQFCILG